MKDKRVTFFINDLKVGGAQKSLIFVASILLEQAKEVYIITCKDNIVQYDIDKRIKIINIGINKDAFTPHRNKFYSIVKILKLIVNIRRVVNRIKPDVIISFISDIIIFTKLSLFGYKAIFIGSERADPTSATTLSKLISKLVYSLYDGFVFQTNEVRRIYGERIKDKSTVIPNPCYPSSELSTYRHLLAKRKKKIAAAGRLTEKKGFHNLIKAFVQVNMEFPEYELVIYGEGPMRKELEKLIADENLQGKVFLPGNVKEITKELSDASIFVLSSMSEGIPNVLMEAMSIGLPVIATNCPSGGPALLVEQGINGLLVPVNNIGALAGAIKTIITDNKLAMQIGNNAVLIGDKFSIDKISQMWIEYISFIVNRK